MYIFNPEEDVYKPYSDTTHEAEGDNDMWVGYIHYVKHGMTDCLIDHDGCIMVCAEEKAVLIHRMTVVTKALNNPELVQKNG